MQMDDRLMELVSQDVSFIVVAHEMNLPYDAVVTRFHQLRHEMGEQAS